MSNPKCPKCGSENIASERRLNGDSICQDCKHKDKTTVFYVKEPVKRGVVNTVSMTLKDVNGNILQTGNIQIKDIVTLSELHGKSAVLIMYEELMRRDAIERGG
ncbi:MAG: hypothetical protein CVT92_02260 [Bacteroidetes bacterium HGW-Bacteroidetes-1]|jgi:uncharacterized Zn ribbon protein|nr:MAG: hypothetical protein CVT92_02260 [Bacteroidetes bacterium HGW-Bacteroidetes-1]